MQRAHLLISSLLALTVPNIAFADYEDGLDAVFRGDYDTAFREFSAAAESGLDVAQYNLAILYFTGQGVDQNVELAFQWTEAAAIQGHLGAQANLGSLYLDGTGVERDVDTGIAWFTAAAQGGHGSSAFALANMYFDGDPVDRDYVLSHAWSSMAVLHEHPEAESFRSTVEQRMESAQLSEARRTFARWQIEPPALPAKP